MKKSEKTEITVARMLASAMEEFGKRGYAGGSVNNICKAGINKGLGSCVADIGSPFLLNSVY